MGTYSNSRFSKYERNRNSCALQKGLSDRTESRMYPRIAVRLDASKPERKLERVRFCCDGCVVSENDTPLYGGGNFGFSGLSSVLGSGLNMGQAWVWGKDRQTRHHYSDLLLYELTRSGRCNV